MQLFDQINALWGGCDYGPTAIRLAPLATKLANDLVPFAARGSAILDIGAGHGQLSAELIRRGYEVTAVEPTDAMLEVGRAAVPNAQWLQVTAEELGLAAVSYDGAVSAFGLMFANHEQAIPELSRAVRSGGPLVFTCWGSHVGFLAEMTTRMMTAMGAPSNPPHMSWGEPGVASARLSPYFTNVRLRSRTIPWTFPSVSAGMELYDKGSPTHAYSLRLAGERASDLRAALEEHLREYADPITGRIESVAEYITIFATNCCGESIETCR